MPSKTKPDAKALIHAASVSQTIDAANAVFFARASLAEGERTIVGRWIAARQGLPGAYAETFAGFPQERIKGIVTFTGERIASASARHILGEETSRVLRQLAPRDREAMAALDRANAGLQRRIDAAALDPRRTNPGLYCCGKCSVGFWRNLLSGGLDRQDERLQRGVSHLRGVRDGASGWRKFPFWYTVLALTEMDFGAAAAELRYAAPELGRVASRSPASSIYAQRRHTLATRALAAI